MAVSCVATVRQPLSKWRLRRYLGRVTEPVRINIGAGRVRLPGWINTDVGWRANFYLDATASWPQSRAGISRIFADNVIEHFDLTRGRQFLRNAHAALLPGGRIRIATPDVGRAVDLYLANDENTQRHLARQRAHGYRDVAYPVDVLRTMIAGAGHADGYLYDEAALRTELLAAGFTEIVRMNAGESNDPDFRGLEARIGETELATTLVLEATGTPAGIPRAGTERTGCGPERGALP
jgi:predicted SAM-dependent methyltransferase